MGKTNISWTEMVWNPTRGCSRVSAGCGDGTGGGCYAERMAHRFSGPGKPFEGLTRPTVDGPRWTGKVRLVPEALEIPLHWRKPRRIFVDSMSDLFHPEVPDEFVDHVFAVMALSQRHCYQILTKRPKCMAEYLAAAGKSIERLERPAREMGYSLRFQGLGLAPWPLPNVWLGISVENQAAADERIPLLLKTPAAVRFLSVEPLLGPVDLRAVPLPDGDSLGSGLFSHGIGAGIDLVIVGGESGPRARPMDPEWARSVRDQCQAAEVPFFFKQWGSAVVGGSGLPEHPMYQAGYRCAQKNGGRLLDGREWSEFPRRTT